MQRRSDAGLALGAPDGAPSGLPARTLSSDPRCPGASQRTWRQIMQSPARQVKGGFGVSETTSDFDLDSDINSR